MRADAADRSAAERIRLPQGALLEVRIDRSQLAVSLVPGRLAGGREEERGRGECVRERQAQSTNAWDKGG